MGDCSRSSAPVVLKFPSGSTARSRTFFLPLRWVSEALGQFFFFFLCITIILPLHPTSVTSVCQCRWLRGHERQSGRLPQQCPVRPSPAEEEEHAVGTASEQEKREVAGGQPGLEQRSSPAHRSAAPQPLQTLREGGAVWAGPQPDEASRPPHLWIW